ncbi:hypothetical protein BTJ40_19490 [Microbulbifer sp. A4B17]|uniref:hypothetical protein n=1 Tax=Microbulbifer sp. A4B17 TaxID=359370 RepID=UPI000D52B59F|nr:hypothetical protein [Microbulbifer sp. A4B17]AWF82823.1 hypothetical protein BTJ40_19490 [Microbulbifer sp. A4B17]
MEKGIFKLAIFGLFMASLNTSAATGPYTAHIKQIQATELGNPYNTIYLDLDITDSPCSSTNSLDRLTLYSEAQYSMALAAFMSDSQVTIYGTGECYFDIERINNMQIKK